MNLKKWVLLATSFALFTTGLAKAQTLPTPQPEHMWLQQFVGEWDAHNTTVMDPTQPAVESNGHESIRNLGGFWTVSDIKGTMMNQPFNGIFTLGYDNQSQEYVGTWVDSMTGKMWAYEGNRSEDGKKLTLESQGVCPMRPGHITQFRETLELIDPDHKVFTSQILDDNGNWVTMMTSTATRIK